ncbi:MAG: hypothetical protein ABWZ02_01205 [Nakamurella sp.]
MENICEQCGTRNEPGVQFCVSCQAYLPWDDESPETPVATPVATTPADVTSHTGAGNIVATAHDGQDAARRATTLPVITQPAATAPASPTWAESAGDLMRVVVEPTAIDVVPGGDPVGITVLIYNLSPIVDAFAMSAQQAPEWLTVQSAEVRLLPHRSEQTSLAAQIVPGVLAPAGRTELILRVQSLAHPEIVVDTEITVTVPAIDTPIGLRVEPVLIRAKDAEAGNFRVTVDNTAGNHTRRVTLAGRDGEGAVRFSFSPSELELAAGGTAVADVRIEAPAPEPGQQATRQLTVTASSGGDDVEASATFVQSTTVEVPLVLRVEPSVVRVRDSATGQLDVLIDNRNGTRTRRVFLAGRDPEGVVRFAFSPPSIDVFAGELGRARVRFEAPQPAAGQESSRSLTVLASSPGTPDLEVAATFAQSTSAAPVDNPLGLRLDPSVVRVRDTAVGQVELLIDNRAGHRVRRVFLTGRDPERLVRFTFAPPSLDVPAGDIGRSRVRLEAAMPDPGQEATRQIIVVVADGPRELEATGSFVQLTSAAPVETPVALKLEPSLVRVRDEPSAQFQVSVDNRQGIRPRRITLAGTDPERAIGFTFWPPVVDVDRGQIARATVRMEAYPPEPGKEMTRQFAISASDGAKEVEADGTFIQSSSPPLPDEPLSIRLDPSVVRVRNRGSAGATVVADNRRGSRPRRVQFGGHDPERVIRFDFTPPVLELAPGQVGSAAVRISAPRPDGGEEVNRPFTVVASDGQLDTDATGNFVQESSDRRPMWRILLTILGGLMMIAGAFLLWNPDFGLTGLDWDMPVLDNVSEDIVPGQVFPVIADDLNPFVSVGSVIILLGALAIFGLTSSTGRLTRLTALVAAAGFAAFLIAVATQVSPGTPGPGIFVIFAGCAIAFIGGLLAKPRK